MNIEKQLELDKIRALWASFAATEAARDRIRNHTMILDERQLRKQQKDTTDSRNLMEKLGTPPLQDFTETKEILMAADKGDCLTAYQLERVEKVLVMVRRLKDYLGRGKMYHNPLAFYEENLDAMEELREEIVTQIRGGQVEDHASRELAQIRLQMIKCEEEMKEKAQQIIRSGREAMADHYYTLRNGRICVPVKKEYRAKIPGSVIDKSSTGNTLFIEPSGVAKYAEELQLLKISEENEIYRILYTLTAMVAASAEAMRDNVTMIEKLDFVLSKGKLSMELGAVEPSVNTERRIRLADARHPLMDRETSVPLQFEVGGDIRGIIITGPNTGGKTVAIKTVMVNCILAQWGLHVTCREADICMNSSCFCDIGDGQNLSENLSTFSAHITSVLEILGQVNRESLVILDELGSGTDPAEGMGIAIAILEELRKSGAMFLATTHYPEVKEYADKTPDICNARMTFDKETLRPAYQMVIGEAGESCAFHIASRLGMPPEMLAVARKAAYGEGGQVVESRGKQKDRADCGAETCSTGDRSERETRNAGDRSERETRNAEGRNGQETSSAGARNPAIQTTAGKSVPSAPRIIKAKSPRHASSLAAKFSLGDSVMVYPDRKIGIVCAPVNDKGVLRVQLPGKKIWISHKRVKLHVAATELYPEDYDFSILFDTVENRKIRHDMERKYTDAVILHEE